MTVAELFGTLFLNGLGFQAVIFLIGLVLVATITMFTHRFGAAEAVLSAGVLGYGFFALQVDRMFTGAYAAVLLIIAVLLVAMFYTIISNK